MKRNFIFEKSKSLRLSRETLLSLEKNDLRAAGAVAAEPLPPSVKFCTDLGCTTSG